MERRAFVPAALVAAILLTVPTATGAATARHLVPIGNFDSPLYVASTPGDASAIYVVEQGGRIIRLADGKRTTFLDISSRVMAGGEQGLLSVAFHPSYRSNRLFYVDYTAQNGNTIIAEFRARGARPAQVRTLLNLPDPAPNHNGGQLLFGPDGRLWWGNGDGGGGGDQFGNGQRTSGFFSKLMRLDVGKRGARWQTWAIGLRNPWRFSFDSATDALYIGDVGQGDWEEVDYVAKGRTKLNFGWNRFEGRAVYGRSTQLASGWKYSAPLHVYDREQGCSITGGYVYRGPTVASAVGRYFYGDYCSGRVWSLRVVGGKARQMVREPFDVPAISSFGEDVRGELYLVSLNGPVYRLAG